MQRVPLYARARARARAAHMAADPPESDAVRRTSDGAVLYPPDCDPGRRTSDGAVLYPPESDAVRRTSDGAVLYPPDCDPGRLHANNIVLKVQMGAPRCRVALRRGGAPPPPRGSRRLFSAFVGVEDERRRLADGALRRVDLATVVRDLHGEFCGVGYFVARLRFRAALVLLSPGLVANVNSVMDLDGAVGVLWDLAGYLGVTLRQWVRPGEFELPTLDTSGNLFHHVDGRALGAAHPHMFIKPGDFHAFTLSLPKPDSRSCTLYDNGAIVVCATSLAAAPDMARCIAGIVEKFYTRRNSTTIAAAQAEARAARAASAVEHAATSAAAARAAPW